MKEEKKAESTIKVDLKKVDTTVTTFLKGNSDGFQTPLLIGTGKGRRYGDYLFERS